VENNIYLKQEKISEFIILYNLQTIIYQEERGNMSMNSKIVANLKGQLSKYSGIISKRFKKPKHRLIKEMLYRMQESIADGIYNLLFSDKTALQEIKQIL